MTEQKQGGRSRRPRGPGKIPLTARENILAVFNRIGGAANMAKWARANETEFYKIYARLIPANFKVEVVSLEQAIEESWNVPLKPLPPSLAAALPAAVVEIARSTARGVDIEGEYTEVEDGEGTGAGLRSGSASGAGGGEAEAGPQGEVGEASPVPVAGDAGR